MAWSLSFLYLDWVYKVTCMFKIAWNNSLPKIRMCPKLFSEETFCGSIYSKWPTSISDHHIFKYWVVSGCRGGMTARVLFNKQWHKTNFIYKPQVKQQPQDCDQTEQQNVRLYPLYHSLEKKKVHATFQSQTSNLYILLLKAWRNIFLGFAHK